MPRHQQHSHSHSLAIVSAFDLSHSLALVLTLNLSHTHSNTFSHQNLYPIQSFPFHSDITYATSPRTFTCYSRAETHTFLFAFVLVVLCLPRHRLHSLALAFIPLHNLSRHPCGHITDRTCSCLCALFFQSYQDSYSLVCVCTHASDIRVPRHRFHSFAHAFSRTLLTHHPPTRCSIKYFSLQCHMFEGLGDLIRAISLVLNGAHTVVSILSHFISAFYLFSFITYCGSCHATSGTFRMRSASAANVPLLTVLIFWSVEVCH